MFAIVLFVSLLISPIHSHVYIDAIKSSYFFVSFFSLVQLLFSYVVPCSLDFCIIFVLLFICTFCWTVVQVLIFILYSEFCIILCFLDLVNKDTYIHTLKGQSLTSMFLVICMAGDFKCSLVYSVVRKRVLVNTAMLLTNVVIGFTRQGCHARSKSEFSTRTSTCAKKKIRTPQC